MHVKAVEPERGSITNSDTPDVRSGKLPCRDHSLDHIPGLKPRKRLRGRRMSFRETISIGATALTATMTSRLDEQRRKIERRVHALTALAHADGIQPVRFGVALPRTVVLGAATCADFQR